MLDLKKLFPNSKFQTAEELKAKENEFSVGDRVKVANNIRCIQNGQIGTIVRIDPEDKHGWKSFIVKFDDEKYGTMGFQSGNIDKINKEEITMKKINENQKVTLTLKQLKKLVKESVDSDRSVTISWDAYEEALSDRRVIDETGGLKINDDVWELAIDYLRDVGVPNDPSPSNIVDNLAVNSEVVYEENWNKKYPDMFERYNGDWDEFVSNQAITSTQLAVNDNVAILNFGW